MIASEPGEPVWVTLRAVKGMHRRAVELFGGLHGVRDEGLLESALGRPRNLWAYEPRSSTLPVLAASLAFAIARNHAFVDGNKRVAFMALDVFLQLNGQELAADPAEAAVVMLEVAAGTMTETQFAAWVADHVATATG